MAIHPDPNRRRTGNFDKNRYLPMKTSIVSMIAGGLLCLALGFAARSGIKPKPHGYLTSELVTNESRNFKLGFPAGSDTQVLTSRTFQVRISKLTYTNYLNQRDLLSSNVVSDVETNWNPPGLDEVVR